MQTFSYSSDKMASNDALVELLQASIEHVQADAHHAILYQALAALHEYLGCQQQRLMKRGDSVRAKQEQENQQLHVSAESKSGGGEELMDQPAAVDNNDDDDDDDDDDTGMMEDTAGAYTQRTLSDEFLVDQSVEVEVDEFEIINTSESVEEDEVSALEKKTKEMTEKEVHDKAISDDTNDNSQPEEFPKEQQQQRQQGTEKLVAEEKVKELERNIAKSTSVLRAVSPVAVPKQIANEPVPTTTLTPELRVEQQKKLAAERRRQDLELQRKLARADQRRKDLQQKRKFLEHELRKQELMAKQKAAQHSAKDTAAAAAKSIRSIQEQLVAIDSEIGEKVAESTHIKAVIAQRKKQPLPNAVAASNNVSTPAIQQRRLAEQARKEKTLEEQKKAAAEKRRLAFEQERRKAREEQRKRDEAKKRRFFEQEQRKQELIAKAKRGAAGGGHGRNDSSTSAGDDALLLKKLSSQMTALDAADEERKRAEETKKKGLAESEEEGADEDLTNASNDTSRPSISPSITSRNSVTSPSSSAAFRKGTGVGDLSSQHPGPSPPSPNLHNRYQPGNQQPINPQTPPVQHHFRQHPAPPPTQSQQNPASPRSAQDSQTESSETSQKYSKMATSGGDDTDVDETNFTDLKRKIIVSWALQPPQMASLRPIDQLLQSVQSVYPPTHDVPAHSYFDGWQEVKRHDLLDASGALDEKKLSKAVRKLRFFLHPDKLPRDLTDEHHFMCKLLWDVTNDAWEDYKKMKEELDWMN